MARREYAIKRRNMSHLAGRPRSDSPRSAEDDDEDEDEDEAKANSSPRSVGDNDVPLRVGVREATRSSARRFGTTADREAWRRKV